ncbi:hypothetical protein DID88_005936 [Monilinia fructigena]|uniref:Cation-transporting P-type ATPase C-terminal domain-containing protein n=1 Tax=Monilinia fructigena TaxID=38457 RepID=A0A395J1B1_9HELO|nr:hypothetical protein DID88_005936 [Monilinia fructigena]
MDGVTIGDLGSEGTSSPKEHAYIKGAIERVLERCDTYLTKDGREVHLDAAKRQQALQAAEKLASQGLRVLGFASGPVARHSKSLAPTSRSGTPPVSKLDHHVSHNEDVYNGLTFAGLVVIMITGDAETTALAIAKKLGMPVATPRGHSANSVEVRPVLRGDEIDEMTDDELQAAIANTSVFARTSPDHKMKIIRALQARGDIVAMTGDGVNDAPALKKADIGISMGLQGTDVAKEASDMILTDDDFSTILKAIEEGKALSLVLVCTCLGFKNPLNAMQILWINIIMDGPPAQSLGVEQWITML